MSSFLKKMAMFFLCLIVVFCQSCTSNQPKIQTTAEQASPAKQPDVQPAEQSKIVAKIGDYLITSEDLEKRIIEKLSPGPITSSEQALPIKPIEVLKEMIAEKAMIIEARNLHLIDDKQMQDRLRDFKDTLLVKLLITNYLADNINVTDSEIEEKIKANPSLDKASAKKKLESEKADKLLPEFYNDLCKKLHLRKLTENFPKAAQIHQRLLKEAVNFGKFITLNQINKLPQEEKNLPLAAYDGGEIKFSDLLAVLHEIAPPDRSADLSTPAGIEKFLTERNVMKRPIFIAGAKLYGLEKNESFLKNVKLQEEKILSDQIIGRQLEGIKDSNSKDVQNYFKTHRKYFESPNSISIDQIWCQDHKTALIVKAGLDAGKNFDSLKQEYSLDKRSGPAEVSVYSEKMFFPKMWDSEPNAFVGPIKGVYKNRINWRIVKITKKTWAARHGYEDEMEPEVKNRMWSERSNAILAAFRKQLLQKYSYQIYPENIKNPLDIP